MFYALIKHVQARVLHIVMTAFCSTSWLGQAELDLGLTEQFPSRVEPVESAV